MLIKATTSLLRTVAVLTALLGATTTTTSISAADWTADQPPVQGDIAHSATSNSRWLQQPSSSSSSSLQRVCDAVGAAIDFSFEGNSANEVICNPCSATSTICTAWFDEACLELDCDEYTCANTTTAAAASNNQTSVEVCLYGTNSRTLLINGTQFRETARSVRRYYTKGVTNVATFEDSYGFDNRIPTSCSVVVDGLACETCELCEQDNSTGNFPQTLSCSNIKADFQDLICAQGERITDDFFVLGANFIREAPEEAMGPLRGAEEQTKGLTGGSSSAAAMKWFAVVPLGLASVFLAFYM